MLNIPVSGFPRECFRCHTHTVRQALAVLFVVVVVGNEVVSDVVAVLKSAGYPYLDETGVFFKPLTILI